MRTLHLLGRGARPGRRRRREWHEDERGATAVLVAVLVFTLVGMGAYVIDVGSVFQERRELQVSADAAALAVARDCAAGNCGDYYATARWYANANATDGQTAVPDGNITFPASNKVRVVTETYDNRDNRDGNTATVDYRFAEVFGNDGKTVHASATAAWGPLGSGGAMPLTLSFCEFQRALGDPPYTPDKFPSTVQTILFQGGNAAGGTPPDCAAQAGQDTDGNGRMPGGFGWLDSVNCVSNVILNGGYQWVAADPGIGVPNACTMADYLNKDILITVFDDVVVKNDVGWNNQCNANKCYRVYGFAGFHLTGYRMPGQVAGSPPPCSGSNKCIRGPFVSFSTTLGTTNGNGGGGSDFGVYAVSLSE